MPTMKENVIPQSVIVFDDNGSKKQDDGDNGAIFRMNCQNVQSGLRDLAAEIRRIPFRSSNILMLRITIYQITAIKEINC